MRTTATCPKCSGQKFIVAELSDHHLYGDSVTMTAARIPAIAFNATVKGLLYGSNREAKALGRFESWICTVCGYTELYAQDIGDADSLAAQWPDHVRVVDNTKAAKGPFR